MDTRTGEIITPNSLKAHLENMNPEDRHHVKRMAIDPTPRQLKRGKVGRNEPCPCGSDVKFKKCCLTIVE